MLASQMIEFRARTQEETEGSLLGKGLATQGQLRKLKEGESFVDSSGQRWWKYKTDGPLSVGVWPPRTNKWSYLSNPLPEEETQPHPDDAVVEGEEVSPCTSDAGLGEEGE
ncbi:hypothetical protein QUA03_27360 [Microcoleus sp. S36b_A4]|uniref:hypothetical protein n=1 Tax=Microcoleus sp. S36b_A4 TaxID=3055420 RepID=UPI002FCE8265